MENDKRPSIGLVIFLIISYAFMGFIVGKDKGEEGYYRARWYASETWEVRSVAEENAIVKISLSSSEGDRIEYSHEKPTWAENLRVGEIVRFKHILPREDSHNTWDYLRPILKTK